MSDNLQVQESPGPSTKKDLHVNLHNHIGKGKAKMETQAAGSNDKGSDAQATGSKGNDDAQDKETTGNSGNASKNAPSLEKMQHSGFTMPVEITTALTELVEFLKHEKAKSEVPNKAVPHQELHPLVGDDDYTRKYPNDDYGAEMTENARVWRTYLDEREIVDKDYISDNNATLDGILVFSSIFSAIVATFVTQTYQSLQSDSQAAAQGLTLLAQLVSIQLAVANGSSINTIPSPETSPSTFKPEPSDIWLNSLWFTSLILSLLTAFLGVLAKQWLYQYASVMSGTARDRALIRQARSLGLHDWHVPALIGFLPLILHLSLALFLAGLIILLHSMLLHIAYFGIVVVGAVYTAYIISNVLPAIDPHCPYRTALTPKIYHLYHLLPSFPKLHIDFASHQEVEASTWNLKYLLLCLPSVKLSNIPISPDVKAVLWKDAERNNALNTRGALEAKALSWLYSSSYNPTAQQVVLEALAGLDHRTDGYKGHWDPLVISSMLNALLSKCNHLGSTMPSGHEETDRCLDVYLRALVQLQTFCPNLYPKNKYYQLKLPEGVWTYIRRSLRVNPHLRAIADCKLYAMKYVIWGQDENKSKRSRWNFNEEIKHTPEKHKMADAMWVKWFQMHQALCTQYPKVYPSFLWKKQCLDILSQARFFENKHDILAYGSLAGTLHKPTKSMCEALLNQIAPSSDPQKLSAPVHTLLQFLLEIADFGDQPEDIDKVNKGLNLLWINDTMMCLLDCVLDYVWYQNDESEIWSIAETELLVAFMQKWVAKKTLPADALWKIELKVLMLLDQFCVPHHPRSIPLSLLDYWLPIALNWYLSMLARNTEEIIEKDGNLGLSYRYRTAGMSLSCWAFDQRSKMAYQIMEDQNFPDPALQDDRGWTWRIWDHKAFATFLEHFFGSIPTEEEHALADPSTLPAYTQKMIDYIHEPAVLASLCSTINHMPLHVQSKLLLQLLQLKPSHRHAWCACLDQLRHEDQKQRESSDPKSQGYWDYLDNILAMQKILKIQANSPDLDPELCQSLSWNSSHELPETQLLVAYNLRVRKRVPKVDKEQQPQQQYCLNLRSFFSCGKKVNDIESESESHVLVPMG